MRAVVVTSLNVTQDLDHQRRCLDAWEHLGCTLRSANTQRDSKVLQEAGLAGHLCLQVPPRQTALDQAGNPAPRLAPVLRQIAQEFPGQTLLLTRPGLYPAMRSTDCLRDWQEIAPALALTAEETGLLDTARFSDVAPCRTRLDAFMLAPGLLIPLADRLDSLPIADDICLGDAGWDLLLAGLVISAATGGRIMDAAVLVRETGSDDRSLSHLAPYVPSLRKLNLAEAPDAQSALEDCLTSITAACEADAATAARIKAFYFQAPAPVEDIPPEATVIAEEVQYLIPWVRWNYDITVLAALIARIMAPGPFECDRILSVLRDGPSESHQISETMFAMLLCAMARPSDAPPLRSSFEDLPAIAQRRKEALHHLRTAADTMRLVPMRLATVGQAARDMIDHGVLTPAMRDALALSCQNDTDRLIFDTLIHHTREVADAA